MNFPLICPVCAKPLVREEKIYKCADNHCFDIARQGYVNLLQSQASSGKRHGDDALMVKARERFLSGGHYACLFEALVRAAANTDKKELTIADLGCGECSYTDFIARSLTERGFNCNVCGIDISKHALISGARRNRELTLAVASTARLPIEDESCDVVLTIFAPYVPAEISRIMKPSGVWIRAFPLERHLMGLKSAIYDVPYQNKVDRSVPDGFKISDTEELHNVLTLSSQQDISDLFMMTPYYYKTSMEDQKKLLNTAVLQTEIEFGVYSYRKAN